MSRFERITSHAVLFLVAGLMTVLLNPIHPAAPAKAATVEEVISDGGIKAYLVREPSVPFISLSLYFKGGAATDPAGKEGLAYFVSGMIDEGAGPYDSQAYRAELEDNAISISFDADRDGFSGDMRTLNDTRDHAFELLRLALTEPRFDAEPLERIRAQLIADLRRREQDPDYLSALAWFKAAYPSHPYGRPTRGTLDSVETISADDMRGFVAGRLALDNLVIGVAGDITADELGPLLDKTFSGLPATAAAIDVAETQPVTGELIITEMPIPQSVVTFGHKGLARNDADYYAAYVANYILGGGGFSSRLTEEVREKRGLAYSVYSYMYEADFSPMWLGGVATKNEQVAQSIELIEAEVIRMSEGDISAEDLANAKTYLTGSFPLRLTSNRQVSKTLVGMQLADLGLTYLDERNGFIEALTLDDVQRGAQRLLSGDLLISVVGQPQGLDGS